MKQVINITLGGVVFAVENVAYESLSLYLESVRKNLAESTDRNEVMQDIEIAISEKLQARKRSEKSAVNEDDVKEVMLEMGNPSDYSEDGSSNSQNENDKEKDGSNTSSVKKRLYRDEEDAVLAGVASGLAQYFDIDPVIIRFLFVISVFFNGLGILVYIILWFVVPVANTTSKKYAMRGEKVTLKEITDQAKKKLSDLTSSESINVTGAWIPIRSFLQKFFALFGNIILSLITFGRLVLGLVFVLFGAIGLAGTVSVTGLLISPNTFFPAEIQSVLSTIISSTSGLVALISSLIAAFIPLLILIFIGVSLLKKKSVFTVNKSATLAVLWFCSVALAATMLSLQVGNVSKFFKSDNINRVDFSQKLNSSFKDQVSQYGTVEVYDGINIDKNSTILDLSNMEISGSLKSEVQQLNKLVTINLSNNYLTGVPAEVGQLKNLKELNLSNNKLTGLPHELGNLSNLIKLDLRGNDISQVDLEIIKKALGDKVVTLVD